MNRLFHILIFIAFSNSIFGQKDTIRNEDGTFEIGPLVNGIQEGSWKSYYKNGMLEYEGSYSNGNRAGKWIWYHTNGQILSKESYFNNILTKYKFWDPNGKRSDISKFKKDAEYPGGLEAFRKMINDSLIYPEKAIKNGIFGRVTIQFKVNDKGEVIDIKILRGLEPLLDNESIRVVKLSGKWTPGEFHNRPYFSMFVIPIIFQLK
jgi:TonB family protein